MIVVKVCPVMSVVMVSRSSHECFQGEYVQS